MTHPSVRLQVQEASPGAFLWTLMETDADGTPTQVARRSEDAFESYEAALAAGTRALNAQLHPPTTAGT
ncbi:hypothetical protein ACFPPF_00560 [Xenophilus aerolatus]|nr:hypothetical protein [Xenophilus aerolatus]